MRQRPLLLLILSSGVAVAAAFAMATAQEPYPIQATVKTGAKALWISLITMPILCPRLICP